MDVSMRRVRYAREKGQPALCADGYHIPFATATFTTVLMVAMLEHTSQPWRVLAEARRVLKPGGRAIMVVPNDGDDERRAAGARQVSDRLSGSPDVHDAAADASLAGSRVQGHRRVRAAVPLLPFAFNLYYFMVAEAASRAETAGRHSRRGPGRHVSGVAADEAGLSRHGAGARRRGRRHGAHDQGRRLCASTSARTPFTSARPREPEILKTIRPFFGEDPLIVDPRHPRPVARQEYVYPLELLQV